MIITTLTWAILTVLMALMAVLETIIWAILALGIALVGLVLIGTAYILNFLFGTPFKWIKSKLRKQKNGRK